MSSAPKRHMGEEAMLSGWQPPLEQQPPYNRHLEEQLEIQNLWNITMITDEAKLQVWDLNLNLFPSWRTGDFFQCFIETKSHEVLIWIRKLRHVQSLAFGPGPTQLFIKWLFSTACPFIHLAASVLLCCYVYLAPFACSCQWSGKSKYIFAFTQRS